MAHSRAAETGIALSVVLLGAALVVGHAPPRILTVVACALFGYFHGHAHGAEMPSISQPALYALGFVLATASLHVAGILVGRFFTRTNGRRLALRFAGGAISAAGVFLLLRL
ncbi:MAG: HupE/UreJ family protein [Planctomycetaceae bacterium]|nr:HupE/UreJ family protein [Planctomycetaceae bacterium]